MSRLPFSRHQTSARFAHFRRVLSAGAALAALAPFPLQAADDNWANSSASYQEWATGTNWDLGAAPTASQTAAIANNGWA
jgi:hypothetical protein